MLINIDLLFVGLAVAGAWMLGWSIFFTAPKSATARDFFFFALISIAWSVVNFLSYRITSPQGTLWLIRGVLFFAVWHTFSFFVLMMQFPNIKSRVPRKLLLGGIAWSAFISILVLTPFVYIRVISVSPSIVTETAPGIVLFGLTVIFYISMAIRELIVRYRSANPEQKGQYQFILIGCTITFVLLILCSFILPAFFGLSSLGSLGGLYLFPLLGYIAYSILQYRMFDIKVATVALLTFLLSAVTFFDILLYVDTFSILFHLAELVLVLSFGLWLTQSVVKEIRQREIIQTQERELEIVNAQQTNLLHFMSHEIKGYLTKSEAGFAAIAQGDFGVVPKDVVAMSNLALIEVRKGVRTVMDILDASNLKKGTVAFNKTNFDMKSSVATVIEELAPTIEEKHLVLIQSIAWESPCIIFADEEKVREHVIRNLLDNAVKYTPTGTITIELVRINTVVRFSVKDSGVGITDDDKKRLFTEGGHGKDSMKINVHSTGYGLFIAKSIVEAHGGKIWAESEGAGKGSRFIFELPVN